MCSIFFLVTMVILTHLSPSLGLGHRFPQTHQPLLLDAVRSVGFWAASEPRQSLPAYLMPYAISFVGSCQPPWPPPGSQGQFPLVLDPTSRAVGFHWPSSIKAFGFGPLFSRLTSNAHCFLSNTFSSLPKLGHLLSNFNKNPCKMLCIFAF